MNGEVLLGLGVLAYGVYTDLRTALQGRLGRTLGNQVPKSVVEVPEGGDMGFDILGIFKDPPPHLFALVGVAAVAVGAMLVRLLRRHRHGTERVEVRLSDW